MEIFMYRMDVFAGPPVDVTGFDVEATDGHIGKVDEATYDNGRGWLVVDTGFWIFGKKRMLPAGVVRDVDPDERKLYISIAKDDVKQAPDYDPDRFNEDQSRYEDEVGQYYTPYQRTG